MKEYIKGENVDELGSKFIKCIGIVGEEKKAELLNEIKELKELIKRREEEEEKTSFEEKMDEKEMVLEDKRVDNIKCIGLPYTQKLLVIKRNKLKCIQHPDSLSSVCFEGFPSPSSSTILMHLPNQEYHLLVNTLPFSSLLASISPLHSPSLIQFIHALRNPYFTTHHKNIVFIIQIQNAKFAISFIIQFLTALLAQHKNMCSTQSGKEIIRAHFFEKYEKLKESLVKLIEKPVELGDLNEEPVNLQSLNVCLSILCSLDEQLWCGIRSEGGEKYSALWNNTTCRINTAYGRLESFCTWFSSFPDCISLAECGLVNIGDKRPNVRHFLQMSAEIPSVLCLSRPQKQEIWEAIRKEIPLEFMLEGEPSCNVSLNKSLHYFPPQIHQVSKSYDKDKKEDENSESTIDEILVKNDSNFFLTASYDGTVCIWNSSFKLSKMCSTDFRKPLVEEKESQEKEESKEIQVAKKIEVVEEMKDDCIYSIYGEDLFTEVEEILSEEEKVDISEEKASKSEKKPEKPPVVPKNDFVIQLMSMGFASEDVKKALIECKNESVDLALDILEEIQKKKIAEPPILITVPDKIILSWACPRCTFINIEGKSLCEICTEKAPLSAYVERKTEEPKPDETSAQEEAKQKEEEEAAKKKQEEEASLRKKQAEEKANYNEFISESIIEGFAFILHKQHIHCPFTIACVLTSPIHNKSTLRLRHFHYKTKLSSSLIFTEKNDIGCYSLLTDFWLDSTHPALINNTLFAESPLQLNLISQFITNQNNTNFSIIHIKPPKQTDLDTQGQAPVPFLLNRGVMFPKVQVDIKLDLVQIYGIVASEGKCAGDEGIDGNMIFILGVQAPDKEDAPAAGNDVLKIVQIKVCLLGNEGQTMECQIVTQKQIDVSHPARLFAVQGAVVVVSQKKTYVFQEQSLEIQSVFEFEFENLNNVSLLDVGEPVQNVQEIVKRGITKYNETKTKSKRKYELCEVKKGEIVRFSLGDELQLKDFQESPKKIGTEEKMEDNIQIVSFLSLILYLECRRFNF